MYKDVPASYDPLGDEQNRDPHPHLSVLRNEDPVHWSRDYELWAVTRYRDVRAGAADAETFSSQTSTSGKRAACPAAEAIRAQCPVLPATLISADAPVHTNNRRPIQRALSPRRIRELEPRIEQIAASLVAAFAHRGEVEFVREFSGPLPITVLAELLGIPHTDHGRLRVWADDLALGLSAALSEEQEIAVATSTRDAQAYLLGLIAERRERPLDDVTSDLVAAVRADGTAFSDLEILSVLQQLVVAGHETTTSLLGGMGLMMATQDGLLERLSDESSHAAFIEESLRYFTPVQGRYRVAVKDTDISGVDVASGERLHFVFSSANRDEEVFPEPDDFDIDRPNVRDHLSFGSGPHYCMGSELARLEARVALRALLPVLRGLRLAEESVEWSRHFHLRGPVRLPLMFEVAPV